MTGTSWLFTANVLISMATYLTVFVEACLLPFQAALLPRTWGPNWFYIIFLFAIQLEYFLWPLEINTYLFKTDDDKVKILNHSPALNNDETNMARWNDKTKLWGSIFSVVTFLAATVVASLSDESLELFVMPWFYVGTFAAYAV